MESTGEVTTIKESFTAEFTAQKMKFILRISSVNVTRSARNCEFCHIY